MKHKKGKIFLAGLAGVVLGWIGLRAVSKVPYEIQADRSPVGYTEEEKVLNALSLSYVVYGFEHAKNKVGTISDLLDQNRMGIIEENFGLVRTDKNDPKTAVIDTKEFVRHYVGEYRFLAETINDSNGFYGAAFCDDEKKCVWISYAGSVSLKDAIACVAWVVKPGLSGQEKDAFTLMQAVMETDEVKRQGYKIMLTGHSLGGGLATEVSLISGCEAVTINGADGLGFSKLYGMKHVSCKEENVTNYLTSPDNGKFSFMDLIHRLMFLGNQKAGVRHVYTENGLTTDTHSAFSFIRKEGEKYALPDNE